MTICISSSQTITTTALDDSSETGADYEVVVNATQSSLTVTFDPGSGQLNSLQVTNSPDPGDGSAPTTSLSAGTITFSTGDGTPSGGVDYWIVNVTYDEEQSGAKPIGIGVPTKVPKFKPVSHCS